MQHLPLQFCKILGHQSKRVIKICVSPHNCPNRYLCELCLKEKTNHQEKSIEQFLNKLKMQHNELVNAYQVDELAQSIFKEINRYRKLVESQFEQFESKIRSIQNNIQNTYHNTLFVLEQLYNNPFNEESLNHNIMNIQEDRKKECEIYLKKGQQLLKQQYNVMHEKSINFKLWDGNQRDWRKIQICTINKCYFFVSQPKNQQGQSDPLQQGFWAIQVEGQPHIRGGGRYYHGLKVGEWSEVIRDGPYQYHYVTNFYEDGKILHSIDNGFCDLSADVIGILNEYEQLDKKKPAKEETHLYISPKALSVIRSRPGSMSHINRSSRKMEKY